MTGLDKITDAIREKALAQAEEIASASRKSAEDALKESETRAEARCAEIIAAARGQAEVSEHIAKSGAELEGRNMLLAEKRGIIDSVIAEAVGMLASLPDKEYFTVLEHIIAQNATGNGELLLSKADKARMPAGFMDRLNKKIAAKNAALSLAEDCAETGGGFVLRYGGIEENLCFPEIAAQRREELSDMLDKLLFSRI